MTRVRDVTGGRVGVLVFVLLTLVGGGRQAAGGPTQATPPGAADKGHRILTDQGLFRDPGVQSFLALVEGLRRYRMSGTLGTGVAAQQGPRLSQIQVKYGKADRTEERTAITTLPGPPFDATVHWYGEYGLCVSRAARSGDSTAEVAWVLWSRGE